MKSVFATLLLGLLVKDVVGYKPVIEPKEKLTTTEIPKPWVRTIYSTQREIVTPTVIAGVTFSAKPEDTPNPLKPWVSLKENGVPVTVQPELNKGITKKGSPRYSTYFMDVTTRTYSYEELKAHNMKPDEIHEEEVLSKEDDTYISLNPIIRCTPERYFEKGKARNDNSAPFCTPHDNIEWKVGETYFASWFTRFFKHEDSGKYVDKVRIHLFHIEDTPKEKGYHNKRDIASPFFSSEWLDNTSGIYAIEVDQEWLEGAFERKILLTIQPKNVPDDNFDPFEYGVMLRIIQGSRVFKNSKDQIALEQAGLTGTKWYYIALSIPSAVLVSVFMMFLFLRINKNHRDFSTVTNKALNKKRRVLGKFSEMARFKNVKNHTYDELPSFQRKSE